jgi:hypothetical protein
VSGGLFVTAQQRSIMVQSAQERAARLLSAELALLGTPNQLYELPAGQALRLEAVEARFQLLVDRLLAQSMEPYQQPAQPPGSQQQAAPAAAPQQQEQPEPAPQHRAGGGVPRL